MSWEDASPVHKIVHSAKASIDIGADGRAKLNLTFSEPFFRELGEPEKANIQFGKEDNLGKLRLVPTKDGTFVIREYDRGGGGIQMLLPEGIPARIRESTPCTVLSRPEGAGDSLAATALPDGSAWIIQLPLDAWGRPAASLPAPAPKTVAAPAPQSNGPRPQPIEAVPYLRAKGVKISKLAGDWWQMDNIKVPRMDVLARVNEFRRAADLKALALDQIE